MSVRPPVPPFDKDSAAQKVQSAEDAWNTRDPDRVASAYTQDSAWRNRDLFIVGHDAIVEFLRGKWERELDYVLRKSLWAFDDDRIAVRFQYEWHDLAGNWFRSYGNELWEFSSDGLMQRRGGQHQRRGNRRVGSSLLRTSSRRREGRGHPAPLAGPAGG